MTNKTLGIDIGSTSLKLCLLSDHPETTASSTRSLPHEGNLVGTLTRLFDRLGLGTASLVRGLVTGTEGRRRIALPEVIAAVAIERALEALELQPRAVVSMGGEDLVVYVLNSRGRIVNTYAGNKCASGTGEFFRQQLGRMNLRLEDINEICEGASVHPISARCSVFMKSDCTHRLNKGEATKADVALSLSKVMADKVAEFLTKAKLSNGQVVLVGGVTRNRHLVDFIRKGNPEIDFVVPEQAAYFEAFGAAHLARDQGQEVPALADLVRPGSGLIFKTYAPLSESEHKVRHAPSRRAPYDPDAEYVLGVDGGSTTTKVALVNAKTLEIVAEHYGRTHGDPVAALRDCLREVRKQLGDQQTEDPARGDHGLVAGAARGVPRDRGCLQRDHRPHGRHDLLRAGRRHDLRDRRAGRQVRAHQQRGSGRLRDERSLLGRNGFLPRGIGGRGPEHRHRAGDRADSPCRRRLRSSSANTARPSSTRTFARQSSKGPRAKTSWPAWSSRSSPTTSTAWSATAPLASTSCFRAAWPRTRLCPSPSPR